MEELEKYIIARWAYSVGQPIISDAEYTVLHNAMQSLYPSSEYVQRSWSSDPCPADLLRKYNRSDLIMPVVITDKTESIPSLNSYAEIRQVYGNLDEPVTVSYKHDGWNFQVSYYDGKPIHGQTRGRASDAMVVNHFLKFVPQEIDIMGKVTVIMELTASNETFQFAKKKFGNVSQRGCVSTLLANPEYIHMLDAHAFKVRCDYPVNDFEVLRSWGFKTPMYTTVDNFEDLMQAVKDFSEFKPDYESPTDGLVVAGSVTRALRVMAWEEPIYRSYVKGYKEEFGPQYSSIGLVIYPIKLPQSTQVNIPATNLSRIIKYNLQPGAPIAFRISSAAIADFDEESTFLLHETYKDRWLEFQQLIEDNERLKEGL